MEQIIVFGVIVFTLIMFIIGKVRYEFTSMLGLLILIFTGVLNAEEALSGFSHPAVITVTSVLVISSSIIKSGVIEKLVVVLNGRTESAKVKVAGLMLVTAFLSAFMNNVGALALILPVAMRIAKDSKLSPSGFLMPVAFASLLGGMVTLIGTPPNLIVSNFRNTTLGEPFGFFNFAPVGLVMVFIGVGLTLILGSKLIPDRKSGDEDGIFNIGEYLSEIVITKESKMVGKTIRDFYDIYKLEIEVLSIIRNKHNIVVPHANEVLLPGDELIIKTDSLELTDLIKRTETSLKGAKLDFLESVPLLKSDEFNLVEVVLREDSLLIGRTALEVKLRNRYNVNLVAVSRRGAIEVERLKSFRFQAGDVLLLQAPVSILQDVYRKLSCLPLAERSVNIDTKIKRTDQYLPLTLFLIGIILTTAGIFPVQISFFAVAVILVLFKFMTPREFYDAIEWPTVLLLATLLPLGGAFQKSGASTTIAGILTGLSSILPPSITIAILMVIAMIMTNLIGNYATAVLMSPIAVSLASSMGVSSDPLLMGVCIACSSAFLTPIGHQSNMLVMGPGGYKFTDYWRLGLPLCILIIVIGTPLLLFLWPL
ncbi:MAG: SLC13 family permease [Tissierellia bacterium]|jgi:di/tricarboxylate transporter|nr:SLC13 family permease [Tissierellia bacterium]